MGLRTHLLLVVAGVALAAIVALTVAARYGARTEFLRFQNVERRAESANAPDTARRIAAALDGRCCDQSALAGVSTELGPNLAVLVTDAEKGELVAGAGAPLGQMEQVATHREGRTLTVDATRRDGARRERIGLVFHQDAVPIRLRDGRRALISVIPLPNPDRDRNAATFLGSLDRRLLVAAALVCLLAVAAAWLLARGILRPLDELRTATMELAAGNLGRRVAPRGRREIVDLGRAFNAMAGDLERQQALRRELVNDVAHELRTPLTALRCRLELVLDGLAADPAVAVRDLNEEVLHLGRLVDDLQELALAEAREIRLDVRTVQVEEVVRSAVRAAGLDADPRLRLELGPGLVARADPSRLRQVVLNILANAARHTPPGGSITVRTRDDSEVVTTEVHNTGSTLDAEQLERVFERFYRTDPARQRTTGGTGLGLAVVRHLVEAQGGRVWATSDASGVTFGFALPAP